MSDNTDSKSPTPIATSWGPASTGTTPIIRQWGPIPNSGPVASSPQGAK